MIITNCFNNYFDSTSVVCYLLCLSPVLLYTIRPVLKRIRKFVYACFFNYGQPILDRHVRAFKTEIFRPLHEAATGSGIRLSILEIGAGSGANFKYLPEGVKMVCVEPNPHMRRFLHTNHQKFQGVDLKRVVDGHSEDMSYIESNSMDAVIASFVLCSVDDLSRTLAEVLRVLKPNGRFCYLEHTLDSDESSWLHRVQTLLATMWPVIFEGCKPCSDPQPSIDRAGFARVDHKEAYMNTFFIPINDVIYGVATK